MASPFRYQPLNEDEDSLRVLVLQAGAEEIYCTLENRTFASKPQYETLSYTWRAAAVTKTIYIDERPFLVGQNVFDALRYLRHPTSARNLWIDAICIDQTNIPERNYQVTLMSFIYSRCSNVLIWLNANIEETKDYSRAIGAERLLWAMGEKENARRIVNHPYWTRVWVIQELILPKEVKFLVDEYTLDEEAFLNIAREIGDKKLDRKLRKINELRQSKATENFRLEQLVRMFQGQRCTEKRDAIFGFLGLAHGYTVDVDYEAGFDKLYRQLIDFHQAAEPDHEDWRTCDEYDRAAKLMHFSELVQKVFVGAVDDARMVNPRAFASSTKFTVIGATVSRILYLGPTYSEIMSSMQAEKEWRRARLTYTAAWQQCLPRFLDADRNFSEVVSQWDEATVRRMRDIRSTESHAYRSEPCHDALAIRAAYTKIAYEAGEPRRFMGSRGCFGMAVSGARVGDAIVTFMDCNSFVVIRPMDADRWMIIGKAVGAIVKLDSAIVPSALDAVRYGSTYFHGHQNTTWDKGEGNFDGIRNKIVLELDLDTLQQLTN